MTTSITTTQAIDHITDAIKSDPGYRLSWVCNIAISIQDAFRDAGLNGKIVYDASQDAANRFIDLLTHGER